VIERALAFGQGAGLAGVLTEPSPSDAVADAPAIVMWNVGIQHRIGPYRIQVDIARDLARRGYASLRFDLSGMGDSEARQDSRPDAERALDDVREAMAVLEKRRGVRTFVPIGFCSSVDAAHAISLKDKRIVGACFLEGYAYRTQGFWLRYPRRLLEPERWRRYLASRRLLPLRYGRTAEIRARKEEQRRGVGAMFARQYPTMHQFSADIAQLSSRGVKLLFLYVGGDTDFNHRNQFFEMVGETALDGPVDIEFYEGADHTFFRVADRDRVVTRVGEWMARAFPPPAKAMQVAAEGRVGSRGAA
jgi:dienelactone hydrolase